MPAQYPARQFAVSGAARQLRSRSLALAVSCFGLAAAFSSFADDPRGGHGEEHAGHPAPHEDAAHFGRTDGRDVHGGRYAFQEHDVRRFNDHDLTLWRAGSWHHEYHNGRLGYWWFAGGAWYFYDQPVYPYPTVVSDSFYLEPEPVVVAPPGPAPVYYCDNPPGYYPAIARCFSPFRAVAPPPSYVPPPQAIYPPSVAPPYPASPPQDAYPPAPALESR